MNHRSETRPASYSSATSEILIQPPSQPAWSADKCALVTQIWWLEKPFTAAKKTHFSAAAPFTSTWKTSLVENGEEIY